MKSDPNGCLSFTEEFWIYLDRLIINYPPVIDRPRDSPHPRFAGLLYPLDYGYLDGTTAGDEGGLDVWIGSLDPPNLDAIALTVDLEKHDVEIKLLLGCTSGEKEVILNFHNAGNMRALLVERDPGI